MKDLVCEYELVGRYRITGKFIGEGSFSQVYPAESMDRPGELVAVKIEKNQQDRVVMASELKALEELQELSCVCKLYGSGTHRCNDKKQHQFIAMELVGTTLAELRKAREPQRFSRATTCAVGVRMLDALRALHGRGYIHRDVKPANFTIGAGGDSRRILMIDFGLARKFVDDQGNVQSKRPKAQFRGSSKYASIYAHQNEDQGRRDDLWSLFYVLVEFIEGVLPWTEEAKGDKDQVPQMKQLCLNDPSGLTKSGKLPAELRDMCMYLKTLEFEDAPDYDRLRQMLVSGIVDAAAFDWETPSGPSPRPAVVAPPPAGGALPWYASEPSRSTQAASAAPPPADCDNGQAKRARLEPSSRALADEMLQKRPGLEGMSREAVSVAEYMMASLQPPEVMLAFGAVLHKTFNQQADRDLCLPFLTDAAELAASLRDSARQRYPQQR